MTKSMKNKRTSREGAMHDVRVELRYFRDVEFLEKERRAYTHSKLMLFNYYLGMKKALTQNSSEGCLILVDNTGDS
jgi:hypothetical protein